MLLTRQWSRGGGLARWAGRIGAVGRPLGLGVTFLLAGSPGEVFVLLTVAAIAWFVAATGEAGPAASPAAGAGARA